MNYKNLLEVVKSEMKPSMGCTEPVALGLAVSNTCCRLDKPTTHLSLRVSSNIFKNAFCVKIPNTTRAGIPLAAVLGCLLAREGNTMELFAGVNDQLVEQADQLIANGFVETQVLEDSRFYIEVIATDGENQVRTVTVDSHDNLVLVQRNGETLLDKLEFSDVKEHPSDGITQTSIQHLVEVAETIPLEELLFLKEAVTMNLKASDTGLSGDYGLNVGRNLKKMMDEGLLQKDLVSYTKMVVSAASDCRMGGGAVSAMTVLGSGNQGFEATLPVIAVCRYQGYSEEKMLRALLLSILVTIRIKYHVGRLSPICGATLSGSGAAAAIAWLMGGNQTQIEGAIQNMLGNLAGMLCDGAKDDCAMKLCTCAGEAVLSAQLALGGSIIQKTDGIISQRVEDTIKNVACLSKEGMSTVDMKIINIMMNKETQ